MLVKCHSTQGIWMWGHNPECTGISLCLSVGLNDLWIRLSKAFGVSGIQAPFLSHGYRHGLSMSFAQGIWKLRMEDGVDFKQSWHPPFYSYVCSPTLYLSASKVKSGWFTCFSVFSFSKSFRLNEYMYLHTCSNIRRGYLTFMLFSPCLS